MKEWLISFALAVGVFAAFIGLVFLIAKLVIWFGPNILLLPMVIFILSIMTFAIKDVRKYFI